MSNSGLISYTRISPNSNNPRNNKILKITPHHMAGNLSLEAFGNLVANPARQMSANYAIDSNGRIGLFCEEKNRSWCSSSPANDHQAITIEVANDGGAPNWHISDKALDSLINLCADICKRNGITSLNFTGNSNGNLTMHSYFTPTACPGPYLKSKFPYVTSEVNKRLANKVEESVMAMSTTPVKMWFGPMSAGDLAKFDAMLKEKAIPYTNNLGTVKTNVAVSNGDQTGLMALAVEVAVAYGPVVNEGSGGDTSALEAQLKSAQVSIAEKDKTIATQKATIDTQSSTIASQKTEITTKTTALASKESQITEFSNAAKVIAKYGK